MIETFIEIFIETLSWGVIIGTTSIIISIIFDFDKISLRNFVVGSFIIGCIKGYTKKNILCIIT